MSEKAQPTERAIPKGYIRVNEHHLPENDRTFFNFTRWTGKSWESYEPADDAEYESLVTSRRSHSTGQIHNSIDSE